MDSLCSYSILAVIHTPLRRGVSLNGPTTLCLQTFQAVFGKDTQIRELSKHIIKHLVLTGLAHARYPVFSYAKAIAEVQVGVFTGHTAMAYGFLTALAGDLGQEVVYGCGFGGWYHGFSGVVEQPVR